MLTCCISSSNERSHLITIFFSCRLLFVFVSSMTAFSMDVSDTLPCQEKVLFSFILKTIHTHTKQLKLGTLISFQ